MLFIPLDAVYALLSSLLEVIYWENAWLADANAQMDSVSAPSEALRASSEKTTIAKVPLDALLD